VRHDGAADMTHLRIESHDKAAWMPESLLK